MFILCFFIFWLSVTILFFSILLISNFDYLVFDKSSFNTLIFDVVLILFYLLSLLSKLSLPCDLTLTNIWFILLILSHVFLNKLVESLFNLFYEFWLFFGGLLLYLLSSLSEVLSFYLSLSLSDSESSSSSPPLTYSSFSYLSITEF